MNKANNSEPTHPSSILETAAAFVSAANLLERQLSEKGDRRKTRFEYILPSIVCRSFSVELLLKCLILIETGNRTHGHELEKLYKLLSPENQRIIKDRYTELMESNPIYKEFQKIPNGGKSLNFSLDFIDVLQVMNHAFEKWRYVHEGKSEFRYGLNEISYAIHNRIIELQPDLKSITIEIDLFYV